MKRLRNILLTLFSALFGAVLCVACETIETKSAYLTVAKTEITLQLGAKSQIDVNYGDGGENDALSFTSSVPTVVSVDEYGNVTGEAVGQATVTVLYADKTATCAVTVTLDGQIPLLDFEQFSGQTANVSRNQQLNFAAVVVYNGDLYRDAEITYTSSAESVGTVSESGVFTPVGLGETVVTATAAWRGVSAATLTRTVTVKVEKTVQFYVNDGSQSEFTLYTKAQHGGKTYSTETAFVVTAKEDDVDKSADVTVEFSNPAIATYDNATGKITALGYGQTTVEAYFMDTDNVKQSATFALNVLRPMATYETNVENFEALVGAGLPMATLFGTDTLLEIYQPTDNGNVALTYADGKVLGLQTQNDGWTETQIVAYTNAYGYTFNVKACTKIIDEVSDLGVFTVTKDLVAKENKTIGGYFILSGNLDASARAAIHHEGMDELSGRVSGSTQYCYYNDATVNVGFAGTLDGNGFKLTANVDSYGLFAGLQNGAVIKNVELDLSVTAATKPTRSCSALAHRQQGTLVTLENVVISMRDKRLENNQTMKNLNLSLMQNVNTGLTMKNVVVVADCVWTEKHTDETSTKNGGILFLSDAGYNAASWSTRAKNVYVVYAEKVALHYDKTNAAKTVYAGNDAETGERGYATMTRIATLSAIAGVSAYADLPWTYDTATGALVWKN